MNFKAVYNEGFDKVKHTYMGTFGNIDKPNEFKVVYKEDS